MSIKMKMIAAAVIAVCADSTPAEDGQSIFKISGFGTLGAAHSSEKNGDFVSSFAFQPNGAGRTRDWSVSLDSRIGMQLTATPTKDLSVVLQMVSEQHGDNSWRPAVEWANVKYAFTPDFSVRVGRVLLPTYMFSESRKVGYTNPWVRPPVDAYNLLGVTNSDGFDTTYRFHLGAATHTASAFYGTTKVSLSSGAKADLKDMYGFSNTVEYGALSARAGYQHMKMSMPRLAALNSFGCSACDKDVPLKVVNIGATYDPGDWFIIGEMARSWLTKGSFQIDGVKTGAYISGGYRINNFTPYVTYSHVKQTVAGVLAPTEQKTVSAGLRWDFMQNADLKLQYDRIRPQAGSNGFFINTNGTVGRNSNLVSAVVDFVF